MSIFFPTEDSVGIPCHKVVDVRTQPYAVRTNVLINVVLFTGTRKVLISNFVAIPSASEFEYVLTGQ